MLDNFLHEQTTNNFLIKNEPIKFVEKFDEAKLLYIIDNYYTLFPKENSEKIKNELNYKNKYSKNGGEVEFDWNTYQYYNLKKYYERSKNGEVEVEYYQNHGRGRYYAKDGVGMASFSRIIRHTISNKFALDLDIKNSSPSILLNLIKKTGDKTIKTKYLEDYIQNRDKFLDELMKNNGMDRKDAKSFYISVMNSKFIKNEDLDFKNQVSLYLSLFEKINPNNKDILEIGCGRGGGINSLVKYFNFNKIDACDINENNIPFSTHHENVAVSDIDGTEPFYIHTDHPSKMSNIIGVDVDGKQCHFVKNIPSIRLDTYFKDIHVNCLKIDVEGS
jgi:hypothetical protein